MQLSQKCQYAFRAIFELAKRYEQGLTTTGDIAVAQDIPARFLEAILRELRGGGFVVSQRGAAGGYELARSPRSLTVGEVIRFVEGPIAPVACVTGPPQRGCALYGDCVFLAMWEKAQKAVADVYDNTTFSYLVEEEGRKGGTSVASYAI